MTMRYLRAARWICCFLASSGLSCHRPGVEEIKSAPLTACPGEPITLTWKLRGDAVLSASPAPAQWRDQEVHGAGTRQVAITTATDFTLFAAAADERDQRRSTHVPVVAVVGERTADVTCGADGQVRGAFELADVADDAQVRQLRNPVAVFGGRSQAAALCVSHLGQAQCVEPGQSHRFSAPAKGRWEFQLAQQLPGGCEAQPIQLGIQIDLDCR